MRKIEAPRFGIEGRRGGIIRLPVDFRERAWGKSGSYPCMRRRRAWISTARTAHAQGAWRRAPKADVGFFESSEASLRVRRPAHEPFAAALPPCGPSPSRARRRARQPPLRLVACFLLFLRRRFDSPAFATALPPLLRARFSSLALSLFALRFVSSSSLAALSSSRPVCASFRCFAFPVCQLAVDRARSEALR